MQKIFHLIINEDSASIPELGLEVHEDYGGMDALVSSLAYRLDSEEIKDRLRELVLG